MDRCFLELQVDGEEAYQAFQRVIENANVIMATYEDPFLVMSRSIQRKEQSPFQLVCTDGLLL
ncbi:hypothetical protein Pyn_30904 [Prunus yedoensis var. nudiflora]|uniref:Uncharacterized protein n=1 Tax=Prunus yedoensis var. nudiflora TaxID=2094558 RepID=A0A314XT65_PRUYE|nr:hypothetical protein Pyn_30904 [Prunus yedoensis var. nudiflora]